MCQPPLLAGPPWASVRDTVKAAAGGCERTARVSGQSAGRWPPSTAAHGADCRGRGPVSGAGPGCRAEHARGCNNRAHVRGAEATPLHAAVQTAEPCTYEGEQLSDKTGPRKNSTHNPEGPVVASELGSRAQPGRPGGPAGGRGRRGSRRPRSTTALCDTLTRREGFQRDVS